MSGLLSFLTMTIHYYTFLNWQLHYLQFLLNSKKLKAYLIHDCIQIVYHRHTLGEASSYEVTYDWIGWFGHGFLPMSPCKVWPHQPMGYILIFLFYDIGLITMKGPVCFCYIGCMEDWWRFSWNWTRMSVSIQTADPRISTPDLALRSQTMQVCTETWIWHATTSWIGGEQFYWHTPGHLNVNLW